MIKKKTKEAKYWEERYINGNTGWDMHQVSPPLKSYFDQIHDKNLKILIPGCGHAYEAEYLVYQGFTNVHVLDIAIQPLKSLKNRTIDNADALRIYQEDFFEFKGKYDLIVEQTFFCALQPHLRKSYAHKMRNLLKNNGHLVGLLFDFPLDTGPPFGGNIHEYYTYFKSDFVFKHFQRAYNSYYKRFPKEIFINLVKK